MATTTLELRQLTQAWGMPVIPGQWRRQGNVIIATYTDEQLAYALACVGQTRAAARLLIDGKRARRLQAESLRLRGF
jgi:hypothetical protein